MEPKKKSTQFVSYDQQVEAGLIKPSTRPRYVEAAPLAKVRPMPTALNNVEHTISVPMNAVHSVEMRTSAVDRSKGFLIATVPLFAAFALGAVLLSVMFFELPFFSLTALVVFWLTFVGAWLASYIYTLAVSAEGIAMFEARSKWDVVKREQAERWAYYKRLEGKE